MIVLNIIPFFEKDSHATASTNITKTSTADFDQGTNSNTNNTGDEMKMYPNPRTAWYSTGGTWSYRKKVIIDHTKVPNTDQTDFPVLINLVSDSDLASKAQDDGDDILLTQEDQTTKLSHEIESFNGTTGALVLWVKIPQLSHTYDTTVYMYYGNASATSQQSAAAVWSNGYAGVWHLGEASGNYTDSTGNGHTGTPTGSLTQGTSSPVNKGFEITSSDNSQYVSLVSYDISTVHTIEVWANAADVTTDFASTLMGGDANNRIQLRGAHNGYWTHNEGTGTGYSNSADTWYRFSIVRNGNEIKFYQNDSLIRTGNLTLNQSVDLQRLGSVWSGAYFKGKMSQFVESSGARSADWIATEYANQNTPASFYSLQAETAKTSVNIASNNISADWYTINSTIQTDWKYRRQITIDHTKVPNTDQSEFPMLVKIADATDPIFTKAQEDGDDILFTNAYGSTKLSHEIETFNTTTKELWVWVKIPTLSSAFDTTIWLYYGNASATSQQNKTDVWSNGYAGVWHSNDATTSTIADSTSGGYTGAKTAANEPIEATGKIGKAQSYDGSNDAVATGNVNLGTSPRTYSAWINMPSAPATDAWLYGDVISTGTSSNVQEISIGIDPDRKIDTTHWGPNDGVIANSPVLDLNSWQLITMTGTGANLKFYLNGQYLATSDKTLQGPFDTGNTPIRFGTRLGYTKFNGTIDNPTVSTSVRSADWIATEYANQNAPETFASISKESGYYPAAGTASWYGTSGWTNRQAVTIDKTKVPNTNQTDFPVLIKITNQSNGVFSSAQADGDDILFTSSNGTTKLSHEIETYTTTAGSKALWAWVKVPILSTSTDTVLYMYYGNDSATSQQNATDVWSNGYAGVWHLNDQLDSTSRGNTGSLQNGAVASTTQSLDGGKSMYLPNSSGNGLLLPTSSDWNYGTGAFTVDMWVRLSAAQSHIFYSHGGSNSYGAIFVHPDGKMGWWDGGNRMYGNAVMTLSNTWYHVTMIGDGGVAGNRHLKLYIDGVQSGATYTTDYNFGQTAIVFGMNQSDGNERSYGYMDEIRVTKGTYRSADWIATEYNNQNSPETFESFGMEQSNVSYASPTSTTAGSGIIDTTWNGGWGTNGFSSAVTVPTNTSINFQMRSSAIGGSTDGDWTAWADLGTATTTGTFAVTAANMPAGITTGTNRYIQTRAVLASSDGANTPTLSDYTVSYLADTTAPTNPATTALTIAGSAQTTSTWTNASGAVVATFSGSSDGAGSESGLAGYYVYFGTDYSADPLTAGVYQAHSGAVGDNQTYSSSISTSDDGKYYFLRIKTKDIAGNISSAATTFDFGYDISAPTRPTFISANPAGYTTNNSFSFTWPAGADVKTAGGWYSSSWSSRQQVTFDHTKVPNTDQSDFPVLVKITDANNELFTSAKSNGYDILFTSVNGTTKLSHEIEKYDATTKELWAWVKVPLLSHETDTKIYMYYGNAAATNQQTATDVWSNGYAGVWHMGEASGNVMDSTVNDNDGAVRGTPTFSSVGQMGKAVALTAKSQYFVVSPTVNFPYGSSDRTLSVWVKPTEDTFWGHIIHYGTAVDNQVIGIVRLSSTFSAHQWHDYAGYGTVAMNQYQLLTIKISSGNVRNFYINGALVGSDTRTVNTVSSNVATIGTIIYQGEDGIRGLIDEPRISTTARSADWIAAEYANQNSPETFMTVAPSNGGSDIKWYEYKRATDNDWSNTADAATRTVSGIASYQEGANAFYVRSVDNAGNVSSNYQQVTYYYSGVAPAKPTNLSVSPDTSDSNSFTLHWHKPAVGAGDPPVVGYYYSINATPTITNVTYVASQADEVSVGASPFATLQGVNTVYVVSVNSAGNLSYEPEFIASTTFTCVTPAPPIPVSVSLYDSSDRTLDRWMLTTQWVAGTPPVGGGSGATDHYNIERSTNGTDFSHLANTTSTAYIDASGLNNSTNYSYRIKAVDNSGRESAPSSIVSKMPTGKYLVPPAIISAPAVTKIKSNEATVSWTTDRASTSVIRYAGASSPQASPLSGVALTLSTGNFDLITNHTVTVLGLNPSTKYYFEVQSMDEDRDYDPETAYSTTYNFSTLDAPAISDVTIENINLTTADISFKTTTVANSSINYGTSTTYNRSIEDKSGEGTTSHKVKLTELASGTLHHFKIQGTDIDGNKLTSDDYSFKTLEPPKAENIKATPIEGEPTYTTKITWSSNVETTTVLKYTPARSAGSPAGAGGDTKESASSKLSTNHEVIIKDLQDNTTYTIQATGRDQFGNEATVSSLSIETPKDSRPPKIDSLNVESSINGSNSDSKSQIVISWHTDEPSTSQVEYGEGTGAEGYGSSSQEYTNLASDHLVILSDLDNQKPYHIRAVSKDASGNAAYSENTVVVTKKPRQAAFTLIMDTLSKSLGFLGRIFNF